MRELYTHGTWFIICAISGEYNVYTAIELIVVVYRHFWCGHIIWVNRKIELILFDAPYLIYSKKKTKPKNKKTLLHISNVLRAHTKYLSKFWLRMNTKIKRFRAAQFN